MRYNQYEVILYDNDGGKEINELVNAYCRLRDRPFNAPPVIVNYFYHSPIKKTAKNRPRIYKNARSRTLRPRAR